MPRFLRFWVAFICLCSPLVLLAQTAAPAHIDAQSDPIARLEQQIPDSKGSADNAWMLMCSALVLLMTGPGLALFYGGMVRRKNVLATLMQSFILAALISVQWAIFGYSLAFSPWHSLIGGLQWAGLCGVSATDAYAAYAPTIPHQAYMVFQCMFAVITPALITGAFAER